MLVEMTVEGLDAQAGEGVEIVAQRDVMTAKDLARASDERMGTYTCELQPIPKAEAMGQQQIQTVQQCKENSCHSGINFRNDP